MIRITKLADYGIVLMTQVAMDRSRRVVTARDLAALTHVPLPTVSKILKALAHAGLLVSHRGVGGGFALARPPEQISVGGIIEAVEGPIALTECLSEDPHACDIEGTCTLRANWDRINRVVRDALEGLTIAEMAQIKFPVSRFAASAVAAAVSSAPMTPAGSPASASSTNRREPS